MVKDMLFLKQWEPILYHNGNTLEKEIAILKEKEEIDNEESLKLKLLEYGIQGEKSVLYELQNSHRSMYILHDINIKYNDLKAQIDFLVMTEKSIYIIECKNMYGNIEIDNHGNFIREIEINGRRLKTGIYSPITQVKRHVELLKHMAYQKYGIIKKMFFKNYLNDLFIPIVVLANEKTILKDRYAPKEIKNKIIRRDQLISYIEKIENQKQKIYSEKSIQEFCDSLLKYHVEKYEDKEQNVVIEKEVDKKENNENDETLRNQLKKFRLEKSKEEKCQAYIIFNDKTLEKIIEKKPKTLDELLNVEGFGQFKVDKYGKEILEIVKEQEK